MRSNLSGATRWEAASLDKAEHYHGVLTQSAEGKLVELISILASIMICVLHLLLVVLRSNHVP